MTNRSLGVLNTRCSAIVNSTTPRFGPRWPPVCDKMRINSSRTSCASCGKSCSRSAFIFAGPWIPSSNRVGFSIRVVLVSEESDFIIPQFFVGLLIIVVRFGRGFKIFHHRLSRVVPGDYLDLLLGGR